MQSFPVAGQRRIFHSLHSFRLPSRKKAVRLNTDSEDANVDEGEDQQRRGPRPRWATVWAETHNMQRQADEWEEVVAAQRELVIRKLPEHGSAVEWSASPAREDGKIWHLQKKKITALRD